MVLVSYMLLARLTVAQEVAEAKQPKQGQLNYLEYSRRACLFIPVSADGFA